MTEPRTPLPEQWDETFRFLNEVLRAGHTPTIREEYPLAFRPENMANSRVIVEGDRVVSHAVFLPVDFHVDGIDFRIGLIGSVATAADRRGQGYASAILRSCEEGLREAGGTVAVLWADEAVFYERQGYARAGLEDLFVIPNRLLRRRNDRSGVRVATEADADALSDLHGTLRARTIRPPDDWRELLRIPRMLTLMYERNKRVVAYACCGRGADFRGVVHEWAGPTEEAMDLVLEHALRSGREEVVLLAPAYTGRIRRILRERGLPAHRGALGMMRVVDPEGFASTINGFFEPETSPACSVEPMANGQFRIRGPFGIRELQSAQMLRLAFGAEDEEELQVPGLPIPLYLRGLDSI